MGRKPIGRKPMTPDEHQQRRRRRLRRERSAELKRREERLRHYVPMVPGIVYWRKVTIPAGEQRQITQPLTRPLAACQHDLDDDEVLALIRQLHLIARKHGIEIPVAQEYRNAFEAGALNVDA